MKNRLRSRWAMIVGVLITALGTAIVYYQTPLGRAQAESRRLSVAPEFSGIDRWFNSTPIELKQLRGSVVLVEFWMFACSNCIRSIPHVVKWHETYKDRGLTVIGVHTPEFDFEHAGDAVQAAIARLKIPYPVAQDNDYETWNAYGNEYWPALYLIDAQGRVRFKHYGEGHYALVEAEIESALAD
ncbi:MAG TPA: thioredoxin family protein, partial [Steroidobacteraceae bacterium]|nr:thioredoxin family protein [Steroidobacteraceae bacterium]